jgi:glycosyltransferase involved in cell wall biosynthesis
MIHLFVNALAASAGGGVTYVRNVLPWLSGRDDVRATFVLTGELREELAPGREVSVVELNFPKSAGSRFLYEQRVLPRLIREHDANALLSAGNFALWKSPVPQILLSRNSLYVSADYFQDLLRRRDYARWLDTKLKGKLAAASIRRAEVTVAPSAAFAEDLRAWVGARLACKIVSIHHGFDADAFHGSSQVPAELANKLANPQRALRLLFVSNYAYYRNFETLLRALPMIRAKLSPRPVELLLTCKLGSSKNPGSYRAEEAAILRDQLGLGPAVIELGAVPYHLLHHVYRACDIYVTPAYAETFAHPLVEAMSSGLPVVASDLAVHREICAGAGNYFPRFSPEALATEVVALANDEAQRSAMSQAGLARSRDFSWQRHVEELIALAERIQVANAHG